MSTLVQSVDAPDKESTYNYERFNSGDYDLETFSGPAAGEEAIDFEATALDGKPVKLSDFQGKVIVLETGSITCPQYVSNIPAMNQLAEKYPDIVSLVLYVREAHPGSKTPAHRTLDEKTFWAYRATEEDGEGRLVLVDPLDGKGHLAYGSLPDMTYVINPEGVVAFRGRWADPKAVEKVIERVRNGEQMVTDVKAKFSPGRPGPAMRAIWRGGWHAMLDVALMMPNLAYQHLKVGLYSDG